MDLDDDCRLRNVMWIHSQSKVAYEEFHDVISFDTTYLVNRYEMPFATVVGVNQHHQSILLGCALLTHEQSQSFIWFFSNWLEAMGGVAPTSILTDQCDSIKSALRAVMPDTIHRFCIWYILYKLPVKFAGIADYNKTSNVFKNIIYDSLSIAEFERRWGEFITEYGLIENNWLQDLYDVRQSWVPVYLDQMFWAGMRSTQRSESMHVFFDGYINSRSTLKSFVEQYEIAITNKTHKELEAEYNSKCKFMKRRTQYAWEEQFGRTYTNNVFALFQSEIDTVMNCNLTQLNALSDDVIHGIERFEILELGIINNWFHKEHLYKVVYHSNGGYLSCNCRKFESKGIFCCHILKLLVFKGIRNVNDRYILRRWRKDVYRPYTKFMGHEGYPHLTKEYQMCREFEKMFERCNEIAYNKPPRMDLMKKRLEELAHELSELEVAPGEHASCANETEDEPNSNIQIKDPNVTARKGRPKSSRLKSTVEKNKLAASKTLGKRGGRGGRGGRRGRGRGDKNTTILGTQESVAN